MKCIRCGVDNGYKERRRNQKRCKNCGREFTFEPKDMKFKITDGLFSKIINDISYNNSIFYTQKQFNYYVDKTIKKRQSKSYLLTSLVTFIFFNAWFTVVVGSIFGFIFIKLTFGLLGDNVYIITNMLWNALYIFWLIKRSNSNQINLKQRSQIARLLLIIGIIVLVLGAIINLGIIKLFSAFVVTTLLGMTSIYYGFIISKDKSPTFQTFLIKESQIVEWQNHWNSINRRLTISPLKASPQSNQNTNIDSELTNYSFNRLIVCQKADIAHFLLANNFHLENNCAILSITGYPEEIFQTIINMIEQNSSLKVYALHDSSFRGVSLVHKIRTSPNWFLNNSVEIYDLGLSYKQIIKMPNAFIRKDTIKEERQLPFEVRQNLSSEAIEWFEAGNYVELESFSPKFLLKVVRKEIAKTNRVSFNQGESSNDWLESNTEYSTTSLMIYSGDTFG